VKKFGVTYFSQNFFSLACLIWLYFIFPHETLPPSCTEATGKSSTNLSPPHLSPPPAMFSPTGYFLTFLSLLGGGGGDVLLKKTRERNKRVWSTSSVDIPTNRTLSVVTWSRTTKTNVVGTVRGGSCCGILLFGPRPECHVIHTHKTESSMPVYNVECVHGSEGIKVQTFTCTYRYPSFCVKCDFEKRMIGAHFEKCNFTHMS
jgi:hypothetical protein